MSVVRSERGITRVYDVVALADRFTDEDPLDSGRVMTELVNNPAHLCEEGVRHLVWDVGGDYTQYNTNDFGQYVASSSTDIEPPTPSEVLYSWQLTANDRRNTRRYGPFAGAPDNVPDGEPVLSQNGCLRRVRVVVEIDIATFGAYMAVFAVLTKSSDVNDVLRNRYIAAAEITLTSTPSLALGFNTVRFDLDPSSIVDATIFPERSLPSAPTGGATRVVTPVNTYWLWVGQCGWGGAVPDVEVISVSAFEIRE